MSLQFDSLFPSKWMRAEDFNPNESRLLQIADAEPALMPDGQSKGSLVFVGDEKSLILNKTNTDTLMKLFGKHSDGAKLQPIVVVRVEDVFQGKPGLRLRAPAEINKEAGEVF